MIFTVTYEDYDFYGPITRSIDIIADTETEAHTKVAQFSDSKIYSIIPKEKTDCYG